MIKELVGAPSVEFWVRRVANAPDETDESLFATA